MDHSPCLFFMKSDRLLTVQEVADYARVKPRRILQACRSGELLSVNFGRGTKHVWERRFTPEEVERWIKSLTEQNTKEPTIL